MTVVDHFHFTKDRPYLAKAMSLCCDAEIDDNGNVTGEPTEAALVTYSYTVATRKQTRSGISAYRRSSVRFRKKNDVHGA